MWDIGFKQTLLSLWSLDTQLSNDGLELVDDEFFAPSLILEI